MKLRSTTPVSMSNKTRVVLCALAVLLVVSASIQILGSLTTKADSISEIQRKIEALEKQSDAYNKEAARLGAEADTLQNKLDKISAEKAAVQTKIDSNQLAYDKLTEEIAVNEKKIENNKDALGDTIADLYVDDKISPLEMLASSKNIGDYLDKQEYRASVRDQLTSTITTIKELKKQLEGQKAELEKVLDDQKAQRTILAGKESEQQQLVSETKGSEEAYKTLVANNASSINGLKAEAAAIQAAIAAAQGAGSSARGSALSSTDYPFYPSGCAYVNDGYGYFKCQCVSYVAYRLAADPRNSGFSNLGNANDWYNDGYTVGAGDVQRGDVIVWVYGVYGHVMYVEGVSGGMISFTDFNGYGGALSPGQGTISVSEATSYPKKVIRFHQ